MRLLYFFSHFQFSFSRSHCSTHQILSHIDAMIHAKYAFSVANIIFYCFSNKQKLTIFTCYFNEQRKQYATTSTVVVQKQRKNKVTQEICLCSAVLTTIVAFSFLSGMERLQMHIAQLSLSVR